VTFAVGFAFVFVGGAVFGFAVSRCIGQWR
jgi:hypothetical protein